MLAPSGGGLILYQAYGNLYAMTGRKAHLLKDKQIPSVGVFDEVFSTWIAFGGNTMAVEGVTGIKRHRRDLYSDGVRNFTTASGRGRLKEDLESSTISHQNARITFLLHFVKFFTISGYVASATKDVKVFETLVQKNKGSLEAESVVRAASTRVRFRLSTMLFYSGVEAMDVWCSIPSSLKYAWSVLFKNSSNHLSLKIPLNHL
ncbi:hypothetical protein Tco_1202380 [Tanacetum coccineum]